jgi:hypothetical protein
MVKLEGTFGYPFASKLMMFAAAMPLVISKWKKWPEDRLVLPYTCCPPLM